MSGPGRRGGIVARLRRLARRAVTAAGGRIVGRWLMPRRPGLAGAPTRVLVIRIDERVGNVLLTTPLFAALRAAFPRARIEALLAASKVRLAEGLVEVVPFERRDFFRRPWAFARLLRRLRAARYDVAIDASHWHQPSVTSALLLAWTGAPTRISHARPGLAPYATHLVEPGPSAYEVDVKLRLLEPLGIAAPALGSPERGLRTEVGRAGAAAEEIARWLEGAGLAGQRLVGLAPGGRKLDHRLPASVFAALGREAVRLGAAPVVLWGPGEEALAARVAEEGGAILAPPTGLDALAALMRRCAVVVTNDTGPMHLAVACGAPTLALFAKADHARWGHAAPPNVVLPALGRSPEDVAVRAGAALAGMLGAAAPGDTALRQSS